VLIIIEGRHLLFWGVWSQGQGCCY